MRIRSRHKIQEHQALPSKAPKTKSPWFTPYRKYHTSARRMAAAQINLMEILIILGSLLFGILMAMLFLFKIVGDHDSILSWFMAWQSLINESINIFSIVRVVTGMISKYFDYYLNYIT